MHANGRGLRSLCVGRVLTGSGQRARFRKIRKLFFFQGREGGVNLWRFLALGTASGLCTQKQEIKRKSPIGGGGVEGVSRRRRDGCGVFALGKWGKTMLADVSAASD